MKIHELIEFDTIGKKFFVPSLIFIVVLFVTLTIINVRVNTSLMRSQMDARGNAMASYMGKTSVFYYMNFDLGALEGFVQELVKDRDVAYAVFYDENRKPLTAISRKPANAASLMIYESEVKDDMGKTLGVLSIGYSPKTLDAGVRKGIWIMLATMTVALLLLAAGITLFVRTVITRPLGNAVEVANRLAEGDLTVTVEVNGTDEIGRLIASLKTMVDQLRTTLSKVSIATLDVNLSANNISVAIEQQATVATQQSAAVTEITSTMEELSASSSQIAEHAQSVVDFATDSCENTKKGVNAVESVIMNMSEIDTDNQNSTREIVALGRKSKEITKVMEIINTIADQTKLIAFNAALEASSAGEAGKRFGVVAIEIRRLADSVTESTGEIEAKISEIQDAISRLVIASEKSSKGIQAGMQHSQETAAMMMEVVEAVQSTQEAAKQISLSTQQQKTASSHVVTALREIVSGSGQTSDAIRRISSISREMTQLSDTLKGQVEKFKINPEA